MNERLPVHLDQYRETNLHYVHHWTWRPSGVSSETAAVATALGRGIVDAPELRQKLVALLKTQDQQRLTEMSNTSEANRLLEARGETVRLNPEKIGHRLKSLGLRTHRLTLAGNGLTFDKVTIALIEQLAAVYVEEDMLAETGNLHDSQTTGNKKVEEDVEAMQVLFSRDIYSIKICVNP